VSCPGAGQPARAAQHSEGARAARKAGSARARASARARRAHTGRLADPWGRPTLAAVANARGAAQRGRSGLRGQSSAADDRASVGAARGRECFVLGGPVRAPIPIRGWDLISDSRPLFPARSKQGRSTGSVDQAVDANARRGIGPQSRRPRPGSRARSPLNGARLAAAGPTLRPEAPRGRAGLALGRGPKSPK
jgi:hypothetical protein